MKASLELKKVVLLGRTLDEYARYFGLNVADWQGRPVLDVAAGVSSFCAEANARGIPATAFDLIYEMAPAEIQSRCEPDLDFITAEIGKVKAYKWDFYGSPLGMRAYRERAYKTFLADYPGGRGTRYVPGQLPHLPFADGQFALTLVSYLLFVYEDHFDYPFHRASLQELLRVTSGEVRMYPLVNFQGERCTFVDRIKVDPAFAAFTFEEIKTDFEFLSGSNSYLRIRR